VDVRGAPEAHREGTLATSPQFNIPAHEAEMLSSECDLQYQVGFQHAPISWVRPGDHRRTAGPKRRANGL
jgi:hypothetical protein